MSYSGFDRVKLTFSMVDSNAFPWELVTEFSLSASVNGQIVSTMTRDYLDKLIVQGNAKFSGQFILPLNMKTPPYEFWRLDNSKDYYLLIEPPATTQVGIDNYSQDSAWSYLCPSVKFIGDYDIIKTSGDGSPATGSISFNCLQQPLQQTK